jgi:gliding motility-associated-like protein
MVKFYKSFLVLLFFSLLAHADLYAQLVITNNLSASQLAQQVKGQGVQVLNPVINCNGSSYGSYSATNTNLGSNSGIILTTGIAADAIGPNNTGQRSGVINTPGSALLNQVSGNTTYDACTFEFDVIPQGNSLSFNFIFASEEYNEWVGSDYNDLFGFYISGPNITGQQNIALLPNSSTPVTINTVNGSSNTQYFVNNLNPSGASIQYDGFTQGLDASVNVTPCQTYHMVFVIADVTDRLWDSGLFIEKIASSNVSMAAATAGSIPYMVEGCNAGSVTFTRSAVSSQSQTVTYAIAGSAINGTDYAQVGNSTVPMSQQTITIPANQASATISFQPVADNISEGTEIVKVYLINPVCNAIIDSVQLQLCDNLSISLSPATSFTCAGQIVQLNGAADGQFSWSPATGLSSTAVLNPFASPQQTTTYTLTATAGSCTASQTAIVNLSNMQLLFNKTNVSCNGGSNGSVNLTVNNGAGNYSYAWTGPNGFTASTEDISNLVQGTYSVTVTDGAGCTKTGSVVITQPSPMTITPNTINPNSCNAHNGKITLYVAGGTGPYTYLWPDGATGSYHYNLQPGSFPVVVTDANGCSQTITVTLTAPASNQTIIGSISSTNITCYGANNGTATVTVTNNPNNNISYQWSNGATTSSVTGLPAGFYTVILTRPNGCSTSFSTYISQPAPISFTKTQTNVSCNGGNNGSATVTVSGGNAPYSYSWSTIPVQTTSTANNLIAGNYTVSITDANGCVVTTTFTITQPPVINASVNSQTNVLCKGNATGSATVIASGGTPPYNYLWNTNPPVLTASASQMTAGSYTCTVTDSKGCQVNLPVTITEPSQALTTTVISSNALCNAGTGSATVIASGGTPAYTYAWNTSPVQTTAVATGLLAGTYNVTVTDGNSCTYTTSVTVTQPSALAVSLASKTNVLCKGAATGSATIAASGGTGAYTYSWSTSPVQTSATATGLSAGTYTVTVKDANNCTSILTVSITEPAAALTASISSQTNLLCYGASTGSASVMASGGTGSYTYSWSTNPVQTTPSATGLSAGTYSVTVKDANNCQVTKTVSITGPAQPLAVSITSQTNISCFGYNNGTATAAATGGSGSYSYIWNSSPAQYSATASNLAPGSYQVTVSDNNQCPVTVTASVTITQPTLLSVSNTVSVYGAYNISCYGKNDGSINLTVAGGTPAYSYSWSGPNGFTASTEDLSSIVAGTYSVVITDSQGCTATLSVTLTQPPMINFTYNVTPAGCNLSNGAINVSNTAVGTYNYSWTGPNGFTANTQDINNIPVGTYTFTIANVGSCAQAVITVPPVGIMSMTYTVTNLACSNANTGAINISITGGNPTYSWQGPNGFTATTEDISGLAAGTYTITATNTLGCSVSNTITVTTPAPIAGTITASSYAGGYNTSCNGSNDGSITTAISGGTAAYQYTWTGPNGFTSSNANLSNLSAGTYQLNVQDANGCTKQFTVNMTQPSPLSINLNAQTYPGGFNISCTGTATGSINAWVAGGQPAYTYSWSGPNGFISSSASISSLYAGTYTLAVTDANGCTVTSSVTLTEPTPLMASASAATTPAGYNIACNGAGTGSISTISSGGAPAYMYSWTGPNNFVSSGNNLSNLYAGSYALTVTDANGCTVIDSITLTQPAALAAALSSATSSGYNIACNGGATGNITSSITGGSPAYNYSWTGPNGFNSTSANLSGLQAGNYTVSVTDLNGCSITSSITLTQPAPITASATAGSFNGGYNVSCNGANDGSVTALVNGGVTPYTYNWSGPSGFSSSAQNISSLAAGTYTFTATDVNSCSITLTVTLTQPAPVALTSALSQYNGYNISCNGGSNGNIDISVTGGTAPYSYSWNNNTTMQDLVGVSAGSYSVVVTDANNCTANISATLSEPALLSGSVSAPVFAGNTNISCFGAADGSIVLAVNGGTQPYSYNWSGPNGFTSISQDISSLGAGNYNVNVTDANGCSISLSSLLTQPPTLSTALISPMFNNYNISCNGINDGEITVFLNGGSPGYNYSWQGPNNFTSGQSDLDSLYAGAYALTVTDTNGCVATASVTLVQPSPVVSSLTASQFGPYNISCNGGSNGSVSTTVSGGISPYSYFWLGPNSYINNSQNISGVTAGQYHVDIADGNNCIVSQDITLTEPAPLADSITAASYLGGNVSCYGATDGSMSVSVAGGTTPYTYSWTGPNGYTSSASNPGGLAAGSYSITVTDANQCVIADTITLTSPAQLTIALSSPSINGFNIACTGDSSGFINMSAAGGTSGYHYAWSGPNGFTSTAQNLSGVVAGSYSVVLTDSSQCSANASITLVQPAQPISASFTAAVYAGGYNISCYGGSNGSIDLSIAGGTAPYLVAWRGPNGYASSSEDINGLAAGSYDVTVSDTNGCMAELTIVLTEPLPLQFSSTISNYNGNNISCNGGQNGYINTTLTGGTPNYTYSWTGPNGFTSASASISNLVAGSYSLSITDMNGCPVQSAFTLTEPAPVVASLSTSSFNGGYQLSCNGANDGSVSSTVSGGTAPYTYNWTGPNGFTSGAQNISSLAAGAYTCVISDTNNCSVTLNSTLAQPAVLSLSASVSEYNDYNISCNGGSNGSIDITVIGGTAPYFYSWSNGSTTEDLSNITAGTYSLVVSDANNCTANISATLAEPPVLSGATTVSSYAGNMNISCAGANDGSVTLSAAGGTLPYTYSWSGPNGFASSTANISGLAGGAYNYSVTDANGCTITSTLTLTEPAAVTASLSTSSFNGGYHLSCNGANDGTISAAMNGGTAPYTYSWSGPNGFASGAQNISSLAAGPYTCSMSDANNCPSVMSVTLTEPAVLAFQGTAQNPSCYGGSNGTIDVTTAGGTAPYTYTWSNGTTTEDISNLTAGSYSLTLTDANGCAMSASYQLTAPSAVVLSVSSLSPSCSGQQGSIDLSVSGGTTPYSYSWSNGASTQDISMLSPGSYTATVTDGNNCTSTISAAIDAGSGLSVQGSVSNVMCYGNATGSIDVVVSHGAAPYSYSWSNGATTEDISGLTAGAYSLTVTDNSGCTVSGNYTVAQSSQLSCSVHSPVLMGNHNISVFQGTDGSIDLAVNGGSGPYTYTWTNGSIEEDLHNLTAGSYSVTVTDNNGCTSTAAIQLSQPLPLEMPNGFSPNGDGSNEYFVVHGIEAFPANKIVIMNRWGNEVYSKSGYSNDWHGQNNKGEELPEGTYFVIITVQDPAITLTGYVDMRRH